MHENRPPDWDWVKATGECTAISMFSKIHDLACRNIQERNKQLKRDKFAVSDVAECFFWADRGDGEHGTHIWFSLLSESRIEVKVRGEVAIYTVKLDDMGCCKLWSENQSLDPWQVLDLALEPLLLGSPGPGSSG